MWQPPHKTKTEEFILVHGEGHSVNHRLSDVALFENGMDVEGSDGKS
jgi:hypothetical protein